jgi:ribose transport system permease protein
MAMSTKHIGAAPPAPPREGTGRSPRDEAAELGGRFGVVGVLVAMIAVFSIVIPDKFATVANFDSMIQSQAVLLMLAVAATVVLRAGDFDLSIAAVMTTSGALASKLLIDGVPLVLVILIAVALGVVIGALNGFFVVKIGVDSFITTLGTLTALSGATYAIVDTQVVVGFDGGVLDLARHEFLGLSANVWFGWLLVLGAWYVYERTPLGRKLLFVGGGRDIARLAGLNVNRIRMGAFVMSSVLASLTGILLIGELGAFDPSIAPGYLLQPFAAAFLGATTIYVGRFNAFGTLIGLYLLTVGITGLQLMGAQSWVSDVFNGVALILAVTLARIAGSRRRS